MKKTIYLAAALFSIAEQKYNKKLAEALEQYEYDVYLPQEECEGVVQPNEIFMRCITGIDISDYIVAILEGTDVDSGTAWEVGRAYTQGKQIIGIRTDFRQRGDDGGLNCMISQCCATILSESNIPHVAKLIDQYIRNII